MTWANQPMTGFALATTGANPTTARIVAVSSRTVNDPDAAPTSTILVNTPADVPADATRIHGYTNDSVSGGVHPMTAITVVLGELLDAVTHNRPVVIFNAEWFFQVLAAEARHIGVTYNLPDGLCIIDPLVLDEHINPARRAGKRTLSALAQSWGAAQDTFGHPEANLTAALRVAWRIGTRYALVGQMTPADLHNAQARWKREADDERTVHFASRGKTDPSITRRAA